MADSGSSDKGSIPFGHTKRQTTQNTVVAPVGGGIRATAIAECVVKQFGFPINNV